MLFFESPAERIIYPIINTLAIQHKLEFTYQKKFGQQSFGSFTKEDWCMENNKYYDGDESDWYDPVFTCELYRVDFVLEFGAGKIAIEIDGEAFHKDKSKDEEKDQYLRERGYTVLRFSAKDAIYNGYRIRDKILSELEILKSMYEGQTTI